LPLRWLRTEYGRTRSLPIVTVLLIIDLAQVLSLEWHEERLLIGGELLAAEGGATYENVNPANEEVIGRAGDASKGDLERAIAASQRPFDETEWSSGSGSGGSYVRQ
jgi:hypothetical protein